MQKQTRRTAPVLMSHDYWDDDGIRCPAGSIVKMTVADAKAMIAAGKAERADPMPGE